MNFIHLDYIHVIYWPFRSYFQAPIKALSIHRQYNKLHPRCLGKHLMMLFYFLLPAVILSGQSETSSWSISYAGNNLWNPGIEFEFKPRFSPKSKAKVKVEKQFGPLWQSGAFLDPQSYLAAYTQAGWFRKLRSQEKVWSEWMILPFGVTRTFLPTTYAANPGGEITKSSFPGFWYYSPAVQVKGGIHHRKKTISNLFLGSKITLLMPYNTYVLPVFQLYIGYQFPIK